MAVTPLDLERIPNDWPGPGEIDLDVHDLPHASSTLEWWYSNCHLQTVDGLDLSLFACFFATAVAKDDDSGDYVYAHALSWALVDPAGKRYLAESLVDKEAPKIAKATLESGGGVADALMRRAMLEMLDRGSVPAPDRLLTNAAYVGQHHLELDYDSRRFEKMAPGVYSLELHGADGRTGCKLTFTLEKDVVRHGNDGFVQGRSSEDMFYYFAPRCRVEGTVTLDGRAHEVASGSGWYDHEFGRGGEFAAQHEEAAGLRDVSWQWLSAQLDDGSDLSLYVLVRDEDGASLGRYAVVTDVTGAVRRYEDFVFEGQEPWTSSRSFVRYPTRWEVSVPGAGIKLDVRAAFEAQEFVTVISRPAFWEGRVELSGTIAGQAVSGRGFIERTGFEAVETLDAFFGAVSRETRKSVQHILPLPLDSQSAVDVVASIERADYLEDLNLEQLTQTVIRPIRTIVDRGGKAWRSYVALACCDAVGGDPQALLPWLAMPELIHVGSLMVDDVEDDSRVRRGGATAHWLYGQSLAINAGNLCYFLPQIMVRNLDVSEEDRVRIYNLYFDALRAAHCGQALDIDGYLHNMPFVVENGGGDTVERHVRAVHRLKSAAPAGCLGQVGVIIGGGTHEQMRGLGRYLDRLGIAFQIIDDVLNLRGFEGDLKSVGEDVTEGKVTMPVAKAMARLPISGRRELWRILASRPKERERIDAAIQLMEECGALDACVQEASDLVESGWAAAEPLLPDSNAKLKLRAFGWYVLERQY